VNSLTVPFFFSFRVSTQINLKLQNMAMLLRWWWKLYEPQGSVWAAFARTIYNKFGNETFTPMVTCSFFWKHLLALHSTFNHLTHWEIGSGRRINIWYDNWMGSPVFQLLSEDALPARRNLSLLQAKRQLPALLPRPFNRKMQKYCC
jgi:hypothetical protein